LSDTDNEIEWKKDYLLKWSDFRGTPNFNNPYTASSGTAIDCKYEIKLIKTKSKLKFKFKKCEMIAMFVRTESWVKQEILDRNEDQKSRQLLKHEQGHFDVAEEFVEVEYSKKMGVLKNRTFSTKGKTQEEIRKNAAKEANKIIKKILQPLNQALRNFDKNYDEDTKHGVIRERQEQYNERFDKLRN